MEPIRGFYYDGKTSIAHEALLSFDGVEFRISASGLAMVSYDQKSSQFLDQIGTAGIVLEFSDFSRFQSDDPAMAILKGSIRGNRDLVHWLETHWQFALGSVITVFLIVVVFYRVVLPVLAIKIADRVPHSVEVMVSESTVTALEKGQLLSPSKLRMDQQFRAQLAIGKLQRFFPDQPMVLMIRHGGALKANAFALPDGTVVATDEIITMLSDDELLAVFCHETGHFIKKHGIRSLIESSALSALLFAMSGAGDFTGLPVVLMTRGYSQKFESEADEFAAHVLLANSLSPKLLGEALKKVDPNYLKESSAFDFLSSHPSTKLRIETLDKL